MRLAWRTAPSASSVGCSPHERSDMREQLARTSLRSWRARAPGYGPRLIADFRRQLFGVLDPAAHRFLGRQELHQLALLVGLGHGLGEPGGVAVFEFAHGVHAGRADELGIIVAHALDAHAVGAVGPFEEPLLVDPGLPGEVLATFQTLGGLQQAGRGADANTFEPFCLLGPDTVDIGDRIGHENLPAAARDARAESTRRSSPRTLTNSDELTET